MTLLPPRGRAGYRLVWRCPDTHKRTSRTLAPDEAATARKREAARLAELDRVIARRHELQRGARQIKDGSLPVATAMEHALDRPELSGKTLAVYRAAAKAFVAHCGALTVRELDRATLAAFALSRLKTPRRVARAGGKRGERSVSDGTRSRHSTNKELRAVAALLQHLRRAGIVALDPTVIKESLARVRAPIELRDFLRADAVRERLRVAERHDALVYKHRKRCKYDRIAPFIRAAVLTGMRVDELLRLTWADCQTDCITLPASTAKGGKARRIGLEVSPTALPAKRGTGRVFALTSGQLEAARKRLVAMGAPMFTWHTLRRTTGTYLTCAPGIFGAASAYQSAARLGHSVTIAEKHYTGVVSVDPNARTLEEALGLEGAHLATAQASAERALAALVASVGEAVPDMLREILARMPSPPTRVSE